METKLAPFIMVFTCWARQRRYMAVYWTAISRSQSNDFRELLEEPGPSSSITTRQIESARDEEWLLLDDVWGPRPSRAMIFASRRGSYHGSSGLVRLSSPDSLGRLPE